MNTASRQAWCSALTAAAEAPYPELCAVQVDGHGIRAEVNDVPELGDIGGTTGHNLEHNAKSGGGKSNLESGIGGPIRHQAV